MCSPDTATLKSLLKVAGAGAPQQLRIEAGLAALVRAYQPEGAPHPLLGAAAVAAVESSLHHHHHQQPPEAGTVSPSSVRVSTGNGVSITPHKYVTDGGAASTGTAAVNESGAPAKRSGSTTSTTATAAVGGNHNTGRLLSRQHRTTSSSKKENAVAFVSNTMYEMYEMYCTIYCTVFIRSFSVPILTRAV